MATQIQDVFHILRRKQVEELIGLRRSSIYGKLDRNSSQFDPTFPSPIALGSGSVGWLAHEVQAWLHARIERRADGVDERRNKAKVAAMARLGRGAGKQAAGGASDE